jgi:hypothetical protein
MQQESAEGRKAGIEDGEKTRSRRPEDSRRENECGLSLTAMSPPQSSRDLSPSERRFSLAMDDLGFGRFESLRIERGEPVLDPWPASLRSVKFGSEDPATQKEVGAEFELKSRHSSSRSGRRKI